MGCIHRRIPTVRVQRYRSAPPQPHDPSTPPLRTGANLSVRFAALTCSVVAANPSPDLVLTPLTAKGYPLSAWLVQYQLLLAVVDPFTNESAWILKTAARILETFDQADCRVGFVVAGAGPDEAREFLGPYAVRLLTFPDPDRRIVDAFAFERLPALVHIDNGGQVVNSVEDWDGDAWQVVTDALAKDMRWTGPVLPAAGDPSAFRGSPARG